MPVDARQHTAAAADVCGRLFATTAWHDAWSQATAEVILTETRLPLSTMGTASVPVPLYLIDESALWRGYEDDAGCRDVLPGPAAYLSSLYAITNPLNRVEPRAAVTVLDQALEQSTKWGAELLLVTNLEDPDVITALTAHREPAATVRLDATCRTALPSTFDAFVTRLGKSARSDLRRRHRRADELGVRFHARQESEAAAALANFIPLTEQAATQHGNAPLYDLQTLTRLLDVPGAVLLTAELDDRMLAGSLSFISEDSLVVWAAGIDYTSLRTHNPYVFLLHETLQLAIHNGCAWMDFGRGTFEFKRRHGFNSTTLHTLVYNTGKRRDPEWVTYIHAMDAAIQPVITG